MAAKKWLRGDPDRPFPKDLKKLNELMARYETPTHEPLWFYRNRGTASPATEAKTSRYQTLENVEIMDEMGLQLPKRAHFFKGLGLINERPYIEKTIEYAKLLHDRGMLVSVYVGGTMFSDYFFQEVPEAINWIRRDAFGQPITYDFHQVERWFPCLNNPGYREYLKKILDVAVQEIKADEIFFDNQILRTEPRSCRCEHCVKHLNDMFREKYTLEECEIRYGLPKYPDARPPTWSATCAPWRLDEIHIPQIQDWIDHRVKTVIDFYKFANDHVKSQSPTTTVGMNIKGVHGHNRAFDHGICHGSFTDILEFTCIDGYPMGVSDGAIVSEVRLWKSAHSTHIAVVDSQGKALSLAENQVYSYRRELKGHGWFGEIGNCTLFTPMAQFFRGNQKLFHQRKHLHDVAVLRYEPATNYNCVTVHDQLMAFEQTLAVEKVPWGIIFDKQINDLAKYRIIALPEIQCLSDAWVDKLDEFMKAGGGVIASGRAGGFNEWYRPRDPDHAFDRWLGHHPRDEYEAVDVGKGRFVYVPTWELVAKEKEEYTGISRDTMRPVYPVVNRDTFRKAIDDATVGRPLTHRVEGQDTVFVEAIADDDGVDLHFINYDPDTRGDLKTRVAMPQGKTTAKVVLTDPHDENHRSWEVPAAVNNDTVEFTMYTPETYGLAQVRFS
ncbi:MAG: beta-galactosidase trimerization domain-containing protein [Planctomycetes bacterium]|nr:beta-galactosidase trimerization domain-containing protein [Planctomycetota bacterium]